MVGPQVTSEEAARLARGSRLAALAVLIGFAVLGSLIGRNALRLNHLEAQIDERQNIVGELERDIERLQNEIYTLRDSPTDTIAAQANANVLPGIMERGKQVHDFTIWIDLSSYRKKTLTRVTYRTADQAAPFQERVAENAINGFSISYRGTDCIGGMTLDVEFADGGTESVDFDMCQALAW